MHFHFEVGEFRTRWGLTITSIYRDEKYDPLIKFNSGAVVTKWTASAVSLSVGSHELRLHIPYVAVPRRFWRWPPKK